MAKPLIFKLQDVEYQFSPVKLERKKIYGWSDIIAFDDKNQECIQVNIDQSGTFLIPKGGTALGAVDGNFSWVDNSELVVLDESGNKAEKIPSSFSQTIELKELASSQELLDHFINNVYILEPEQSDIQALTEKLKSGQIFKFQFNYRDSYDADSAFMLESNGTVFILVGKPGEFNYIGLEETSLISDDEAVSEGEDEIDFSMM
jgi:hypothetical protein